MSCWNVGKNFKGYFNLDHAKQAEKVKNNISNRSDKTPSDK